jgi:hypothetical protein
MFRTVEADEQEEIFWRKARYRNSIERNLHEVIPHPHGFKRERQLFWRDSPVQTYNNMEEESAVIAGIQLVVIEYETIFVILAEISCFSSLSRINIPEPVSMGSEEVLCLQDVSFRYQDIKVAELPQRHISISSCGQIRPFVWHGEYFVRLE